MAAYLSEIALVVTFLATLVSILYLLGALVAAHRWPRQADGPGCYREPVTLLKPVCGVEPGLYENLRSFCAQDYPAYQVIFGVRDAHDPAIAIIERVIADLPEQDLSLVVDPTTIGTNLKISNLANLVRTAKHGIVLIADSDMRVDRHYLSKVMAPFEHPDVGAVTCLYKGAPTGGLPSALGAMFINEWFFPSVLVALCVEDLRYCFGATMAVRRDILNRLGGFATLADELADDHVLGRLVGEQGYKVRLAPYIVENIVHEGSIKELFLHELRWAKTVRSVRPFGYAFSCVTYALPMSVFFFCATRFSPFGLTAVALAIGLRLWLHFKLGAAFANRGYASPWLVPARDVLSFVTWGASFLGRRVHWRDNRFDLNSAGQLVQEGKIIP